MHYPSPLVEARLLRRYKRFLADMELEDGAVVTAHCANPGAMLGLTTPGSRAMLSRSNNPKRALPWSWELVEIDAPDSPQWVGINTSRPNALAEEALRAGVIPQLAGYDCLRREVRYGRSSRIDILLEHPGRPPCYVEIKNVHLMRQRGLAEFPDCVTARGAKHLVELADMVSAGNRAVMLYVVQMRADAFALAPDLDPGYAAAWRAATAAGVESIAVVSQIDTEEQRITSSIPLLTRDGRPAAVCAAGAGSGEPDLPSVKADLS
ncbi:DNA/RNA nuclease SfsA [Camelimonas lactis]|uniref:Sugar fermentation stimulation protein homolog n=1 Tax=Camelimonas lactis TaxID=659006 RepID=A0A4R2GQB4_9HYPH|nr:DNA/RNA nuclease SfsA [Camelimonas lactis]TCO11522.1 sugar fermentation stimulation protein A [Camelimonas lactis]